MVEKNRLTSKREREGEREGGERAREREWREGRRKGVEGGRETVRGMGEIIKTMRGSEGASELGATGEETDGGWEEGERP